MVWDHGFHPRDIFNGLLAAYEVQRTSEDGDAGSENGHVGLRTLIHAEHERQHNHCHRRAHNERHIEASLAPVHVVDRVGVQIHQQQHDGGRCGDHCSKESVVGHVVFLGLFVIRVPKRICKYGAEVSECQEKYQIPTRRRDGLCDARPHWSVIAKARQTQRPLVPPSGIGTI